MIDLYDHNGTDVMLADVPVGSDPVRLNAVIINRDTQEHWITNPHQAVKHEGWRSRPAIRIVRVDERADLITRARRILTAHYATTPLKNTCDVVADEGDRVLVRRLDVAIVPTHWTVVIIDRVHGTAVPTTMAIALAQFPQQLLPPLLDDPVRDALIAQAVQVFRRAGPTRAD